MSHFYICCKQVALGGDVIGSLKCGTARSVVMAYWPGHEDDLSDIIPESLRVGVVQHYIKHTVSMTYPTETESSKADHVFARVSWKQKHPSEALSLRNIRYCLF